MALIAIMRRAFRREMAFGPLAGAIVASCERGTVAPVGVGHERAADGGGVPAVLVAVPDHQVE